MYRADHCLQVTYIVPGKRYDALYTIYLNGYPTTHNRYISRILDSDTFLYRFEYTLLNHGGKVIHELGFQEFRKVLDGFTEKSLFKKPKGFKNNFKAHLVVGD